MTAFVIAWLHQQRLNLGRLSAGKHWAVSSLSGFNEEIGIAEILAAQWTRQHPPTNRSFLGSFRALETRRPFRFE